MTRCRRGGRLAASTAIAGVALVGGGAFASSAGAQTVTQEIVVSVGATAATNPYYEAADSGASVGGTIEIRPRVTYDASVTRFDLEAFAQGTAYADNYGFEDNYGAFASARHRASEQLSLHMNAGITSTASSVYGELWTTGGIDAGPNEPVPPPPSGDITVLGQRGRNTKVSAGGGVDYAIDALNQLGLAGSYETTSMTHPGANDYEVVGVTGRYSRVLNERASIGLVAAREIVTYGDPLVSDARTASARGSLSLRLDEFWTLSADAGVERTNLEASPTAAAFASTSLTANGTLCRRSQREGFCLDFSRQSRPTAYAGVRNTDMASFSYNLQVSEYDSLTLGGSYSRSSGLNGDLNGDPATSAVGVRGGYERRFNQRLSGYIDVSADRLRNGGLSLDPRARFGAGIRYRFGRSQ